MTEQKPDSAAGAPHASSGPSRWVGRQPARGAPAAGLSKPANDLTAACEQLLSRAQQLDSAALRDALLDLHEFWLSTKAAEIGITATSGFAIVATGGLGRRELVPYSDLDLMLLHDNMPDDVVTQVAELLWYPLWDANIRLDHSVRTVPEALKVAGEDISAGLAMLEVRHIAGDSDLSSLLVAGARRQWRTGIASRFDELVEHTQQRWQRSGEIAHRAEPDLKCGRGGLRDVQLLNALAIAQLADVYPSQSLASPTGRSARRTWRCSTYAPNCTGSPAVAVNSCWPSSPTRSARHCASVTDSTWRACSPTPPAPSASTSTPGCALRPTRCRAGASPRFAGRCAVRSTKVSSSSPAR